MRSRGSCRCGPSLHKLGIVSRSRSEWVVLLGTVSGFPLLIVMGCRVRPLQRPTNPPPPGSFPPPILTPSTATGYESDSSYVSSQPNFTTAQPSTASPSLLTGTSIRDTGLSAIVERDQEGVIALSDEEEEEEEGDEQSEEDEVRRPDAGEMRKGVEGERVVKSGYLLKKGERRKVSVFERALGRMGVIS